MSETRTEYRADKVAQALLTEQLAERTEQDETLARERRTSERIAQLLADPARPPQP